MARAARPLTRVRLGSTNRYRAVAEEGVLLLGGGRALLLQLAEPRIAAGVAAHSGFATDPLKRLAGTLTYLYVLAFGTDDEVARVARHVGGAHRGVRGEAPVPYDARDVDLQLWVAATLFESTATMYELFVAPMSEEAADQLYDESSRIGTALGMPASAWPPSREAFDREWQRRLRGLRVSPEARTVAVALMRPESLPLLTAILMPSVRLLTAGLLTPELRVGYEIRWTERHQARFERLVRRIRAVYRFLPRPLRTLPARTILHRFRAAA